MSSTESTVKPVTTPPATGRKPQDDELDVCGLTHIGKLRKTNQDHFLICALRKQMLVLNSSLPDIAERLAGTERLAFLAMVADGVGGTQRGEAASRLGVWPRAYLLQVGDSRCYVLRDGKLTQISRDQTMAEELVQQGVLTRTDAFHTPWANVLSSALGGPQHAPVVTRMEQRWGDVG